MSNIRLFFQESLSLNLISKLDKSQSHYLYKVMRKNIGQIFSLFILVVAAAEAAIGLAILTIFFKKTTSISIDNINKLKG